ncbi:MAG: acyl-CoA dehydratase activase-related protein [Dermatophilaceae bacterium]
MVAGAPEVMKAAFTKEVDFFAQRGIEYLDPALTFAEMHAHARSACSRRWGPRLGITEDESDHAHREAHEGARRSSSDDLQEKGRAILETVEAENRVAILDGRPARTTPIPGLNHGIPEEFQVLGYPILSRALASRKDTEYLARYFKDEVARGQHPSRHQRRVARELLGQQRAEGVGGEVRRAPPERRACSISRASSAATTRRPTASIDSIVDASATPYAALHDIDANKPGGSIKIRVKTYAHTLKLHEERARGRGQARRPSSRVSARHEAPRAARSCKQAQLERAPDHDPALDAQIEELGDEARGVRRARSAPPEPAKGLVQLKKKTQDGDVVDASVAALRRASGAPRTRADPGCRNDETRQSDDRTRATHADRSDLQASEAEPARASSDVDIEAELARVRRGASASASGIEEDARAVGRQHARARRSTKRARARHAAHRRPHARRRTSSSRARCAGIGYNVQHIDVPRQRRRCSLGKEFGNRGQCNPTYFTVGNLVKHLMRPARQARA